MALDSTSVKESTKQVSSRFTNTTTLSFDSLYASQLAISM